MLISKQIYSTSLDKISSESGNIKNSPLAFKAPIFLEIKVPLFFLFFINIILGSLFLHFSMISILLSSEQSSINISSMSINFWFRMLLINIGIYFSLLKTDEIIETLGYSFLLKFLLFNKISSLIMKLIDN